MTNNTTQRVTIAVTYTPETDIMDAAQSTHDWAEAVAKDARMSPNVVAVEVNDVPITPDRPVAFTFEESARIIEFMRKFEASSEANALLHMIATRNMYATVADLDLEDGPDDEPRAPKFDDVKSQAVLPMTSISVAEKSVLFDIATKQKTTFDGYVKVYNAATTIAAELAKRGLLEQKKTAIPNDIYRTTEGGNTILAVLGLVKR